MVTVVDTSYSIFLEHIYGQSIYSTHLNANSDYKNKMTPADGSRQAEEAQRKIDQSIFGWSGRCTAESI